MRNHPILAIAMFLALPVVVGCGSTNERQSMINRSRRSSERTVEFTKSQALDVQLAVARALADEGNVEQALHAYRTTLAQHPKSPEAHHRLAIMLDQQGRFDESNALFRKALDLGHGNADVYCDLGYSQYLQRRWADAERNLQQAVKIDPDNRRAHTHLGLVLCRMDQREQAIAEFRRAGCTQAEAYVNLGVAHAIDGDLDVARESFTLALGIDPNVAFARDHLAALDSGAREPSPLAPPSIATTTPELPISGARNVVPVAAEASREPPVISLGNWEITDPQPQQPAPVVLQQSESTAIRRTTPPSASSEPRQVVEPVHHKVGRPAAPVPPTLKHDRPLEANPFEPIDVHDPQSTLLPVVPVEHTRARSTTSTATRSCGTVSSGFSPPQPQAGAGPGTDC